MRTSCRRLFCYLLITVILFILNVRLGFSQSADSLTTENYLEIGISTLYSPSSFAAWGKIENSSAISIRGQFWHSRISWKNLNARLGSELILTQRLNYPVNGIDGPRDQRTGFGIVPLNILLPITHRSNIRPFTFFSAGGIFLNEKLPVGSGASLNYLLNVGAGLELPFIDNSNIQFGYSIQHMSNANTGQVNPGIDSHMFFLTILLP